jgi:hypothetical protein
VVIALVLDEGGVQRIEPLAAEFAAPVEEVWLVAAAVSISRTLVRHPDRARAHPESARPRSACALETAAER